jgi:hypothetical protein
MQLEVHDPAVFTNLQSLCWLRFEGLGWRVLEDTPNSRHGERVEHNVKPSIGTPDAPNRLPKQSFGPMQYGPAYPQVFESPLEALQGE